jgi:hypothetical protein
VKVTGSEHDLTLAGTADAGADADVVVTLRSGERPEAARTWLVWAADPGGAAAAAGADRVLAPAGDGLWRRAPWPVADGVFDLPAVDSRAGVVVVAEGSPDARAAAVAALADRDIAADAVDRLSIDVLSAAPVVVVLGDGHLPAAGMAVPAAGRMLVTVGCETSFGLVAGSDHLAADSVEAAAALVEVGLDQWAALAPMRALGRRAAERHRASEVYRRVLEDLAIEASSAGPSGMAG